MTTGLSLKDENTIKDVLRKHPAIKRVFIFGSRAKGTYHAGSDIDLVVLNEDVSRDEMLHVKSELDDTNLPYKIDIIHYPSITGEELRQHILRVGRAFYEC